MTDKDIRKLEQVMERVIRDILEVDCDDDDETSIPMSIIEQMEDYLGEPILFMAIS